MRGLLCATIILSSLTFSRLIGAEVTVGDQAHRLASLNGKDTDKRLKRKPGISDHFRQPEMNAIFSFVTYLDHEQQEVQVKVQT